MEPNKYESLIGAVSTTDLVLALLAVGALMIAPRLARMAANWIKGSVR